MLRPILTAALIAALCFSAGGCKRKRDRIRVQQTEEETPRLATVIHTSDPRSSSQLLSGWHDIEQNAWRWTEGKFSVLLRPPRGSAEKGAVLQLKFSIPEPVIAKLKTVSLAATVAGKSLGPETYTQAGEYVYSRDVPPGQTLSGESVKVDFALDRWLAPGDVDQRELGVVVSTVGFEPK